VPSRLVAPLLVLVALAAAVLVTVPFLGLGIVALVYLATIPYTIHRHRWLRPAHVLLDLQVPDSPHGYRRR